MKIETYIPKNSWETEVLEYDPFEGNFGNPGDQIFKDRMVTARKANPCSMCSEVIIVGERSRYIAAKFDGQLMSYRYCNLCCNAMFNWLETSGESVYERIK